MELAANVSRRQVLLRLFFVHLGYRGENSHPLGPIVSGRRVQLVLLVPKAQLEGKVPTALLDFLGEGTAHK